MIGRRTGELMVVTAGVLLLASHAMRHHRLVISLARAAPTAKLWDAVRTGNVPAATALVARGADVRHQGPGGETLLHAAADGAPQNGARDEMVDYLLSRGLDPNARDLAGRTPLMFAAYWRRTRALDSLISAGANVDAGNRTGMTALMEAAALGKPGLVGHLITRGAAPNTTDRCGNTALDYAALASRTYPPEHPLQLELRDVVKRLVHAGGRRGKRVTGPPAIAIFVSIRDLPAAQPRRFPLR